MPSAPISYWRMIPTGLKPTFLYAPDRPLGGERRTDCQPVVPALLEEMARQCPQRVAPQPLAEMLVVERDVDSRRLVVRIGLLGIYDKADDPTVQFDSE